MLARLGIANQGSVVSKARGKHGRRSVAESCPLMRRQVEKVDVAEERHVVSPAHDAQHLVVGRCR